MWLRVVAVVAAWAALALALWYWLAPKGYNTSDYGFIIGQSWRVLNGETPHADFISARPAGSAVLHMIDFLLPLPLVEASRLVAVALSVLVAVFAGVAVLGRAPWRWSVIGHLVAATAALLTINTFQVGPWYTTDGLVFTLGAFAGLRLWEQGKGALSVPVVALLLAGTPPLFKQSFFLTVPLAAAWVVLRLGQRHQLTWKRVLLTLAALAVPGVVYIAWVGAGGGLEPMISQLASATQPDWIGTIGSLSLMAPPLTEALVAAGAVAVAVVVWLRRRDAGSAAASDRRLLAVALGAAAAYLAVIAVTTASGLSMYEPRWSTRLFWVALLTSLVASVATGRPRLGEYGVLAAAWMSLLSWGMPWPLLVGGSLSLVVAQVLAEPTGDVLRSSPRSRRALTPWVLSAVLALTTTAAVMRDSINTSIVHRDRPASQLTVPLRSLDPDFGRTLTNPTTAQFLQDAVACVRRHPAQNVVFGSWNSDLYAVLGLRNPVATDGSNNYEITGAVEQYRDSVRRLAERGDYLFLMPLVNPESVHTLESLPRATPETPIPEYWFTSSVPYSWIASTLGGERVACGSWIGFWSPVQSAAAR